MTTPADPGARVAHPAAIQALGTGKMKGIALHAVDALALVDVLILRLRTLVPPIRTLVFSGH
jgi:hypothetical protein